MAVSFVVSTAFAIELPSSQPIKGTEGPDARLHVEGRPFVGEGGAIVL